MDAVIYGDVNSYEAYYAFSISAWQVGADGRMVSTRTGEELFSGTDSRYSVNLQLALDPLGIALSSVISLLELRDVTLARPEEEDAREIIMRIPRSPRLQSQRLKRRQDNLE